MRWVRFTRLRNSWLRVQDATERPWLVESISDTTERGMTEFGIDTFAIAMGAHLLDRAHENRQERLTDKLDDSTPDWIDAAPILFQTDKE